MYPRAVHLLYRHSTRLCRQVSSIIHFARKNAHGGWSCQVTWYQALSQSMWQKGTIPLSQSLHGRQLSSAFALACTRSFFCTLQCRLYSAVVFEAPSHLILFLGPEDDERFLRVLFPLTDVASRPSICSSELFVLRRLDFRS